jgi:hypothetical protein
LLIEIPLEKRAVAIYAGVIVFGFLKYIPAVRHLISFSVKGVSTNTIYSAISLFFKHTCCLIFFFIGPGGMYFFLDVSGQPLPSSVQQFSSCPCALFKTQLQRKTWSLRALPDQLLHVLERLLWHVGKTFSF